MIASLYTEGENEIKFPCYNVGYSEPWSRNADVTVIGIGDGKACRYLIKNSMRRVDNPTHLKETAVCASDYDINAP